MRRGKGLKERNGAKGWSGWSLKMVTVIFDILEPPLFENIGVGSFKHFVFVFVFVCFFVIVTFILLLPTMDHMESGMI